MTGGLGRRRAFSLLHFFLAGTLTLALCLPWVQVPVFGMEIPALALNKAGIAGLLLSFSLTFRALGGEMFRWVVRLVLVPASYFWWFALDGIRTWGIKTMGPLQLKMAGMNSALAKMGMEPLEIYNAHAWKNLEPTRAWYLMGACLGVTVLITVLDGRGSHVCSSCSTKGRDQDRFCHSCGTAFLPESTCSHCGGEGLSGDEFCRHCGRKLGI